MIKRIIFSLLIVLLAACTEPKTEQEVLNQAVMFCGSVNQIQALEKYYGYYSLRCVDSRKLHIMLNKD